VICKEICACKEKVLKTNMAIKMMIDLILRVCKFILFCAFNYF